MPFVPRPSHPPAGSVLERLHALQAEQGHLSRSELRRAAADLGVPVAQVYGAATFYRAFSFEPRGRHTIQICLGTACYVRGAGRLLEELVARLGVGPGGTTADRLFTLETVYCLGSCSLSPVVRIDQRIYGRLETRHIPALLESFRRIPAEVSS